MARKTAQAGFESRRLAHDLAAGGGFRESRALGRGNGPPAGVSRRREIVGLGLGAGRAIGTLSDFHLHPVGADQGQITRQNPAPLQPVTQAQRAGAVENRRRGRRRHLLAGTIGVEAVTGRPFCRRTG